MPKFVLHWYVSDYLNLRELELNLSLFYKYRYVIRDSFMSNTRNEI